VAEKRFVLCPAILIVVTALFLVSCAVTGPGGKKSLVLISSKQEISIGQEMDGQVKASEKILPDTAWQGYLNRIGQRIVAVSDRADLPFHFAVIESDEVNAFAAPGGFVYVYTGLLRELDQESELAAVLAHEISHVVARHSVKRLQSVMGVSVLMELALGNKSANAKSLAQNAIGIVMQGYSRSQEKEADNFGITYMTLAGWDPNGAVLMFEKLKALSGDQPSGFFERISSSHPDTQDRLNSAKAEIANMQPLKKGLLMNGPEFSSIKKKLPPKQEKPKQG